MNPPLDSLAGFPREFRLGRTWASKEVADWIWICKWFALATNEQIVDFLTRDDGC